MTTLLVLLGVIGTTVLAIWAFVASTPAQIVSVLRIAAPVLLALFGGVALMTGRIGLAAPLVVMAYVLWSRNRAVQMAKPSPNHKSVVRTSMLEMELDHESGLMNGLVLVGAHEGRVLDDLDDEAVTGLVAQMQHDRESLELLEAYLDRRMPGWRDGMDADTGARQSSTRQSGTMTHEEAYQILGLEAGASAAEIRKAHRRLMQGVHPDVGGSSFLASRINEAKDLLLRSHR